MEQKYPYFVRNKPVIKHADKRIRACRYSTLIAYKVPYGWCFNAVALFVEGKSDFANKNCTFSILVNGAIDDGCKEVRLNNWNINKENNILSYTICAGEKLEVKIRNNHVSQSFSIRGILVGVREPTD